MVNRINNFHIEFIILKVSFISNIITIAEERIMSDTVEALEIFCC